MSRPSSGYEEAEDLRAELLACPQETRMARLREDPRFLNPKLSELLVEACQAALPFEPRHAFFLAVLVAELCRLLAENVVEPEVEVLCRALYLGNCACRLLGQHEAAEGILEIWASLLAAKIFRIVTSL